jgi:hypothetical protein
MSPLPSLGRRAAAVALALAALLVLTRFGHFGELSRLPDASWAVFFLGGLALRRWRAFAAFFALAWVVDAASVALGTPADCFSVAYLFLVPAYGALWYGGRLAAARGDAASAPSVAASAQALPAIAAALVVAVAVAFVVSNAGFHLFGGSFGRLTAGEYAQRVLPYLPGYLLVTTLYVGLGLAAAGVAFSARAGRGRESA